MVSCREPWLFQKDNSGGPDALLALAQCGSLSAFVVEAGGSLFKEVQSYVSSNSSRHLRSPGLSATTSHYIASLWASTAAL